MSEEIAKLKYPSERRPTLIYTNDEATVNVAFNQTTTPIKDNKINDFKQSIQKMFENLYPNAKWIRSNVLIINNKNVGILELLTPALDGQVYNLIFFMEVDGKLLLSTFNCTEKQMMEWQPIAHKIMQSIKIK